MLLSFKIPQFMYTTLFGKINSWIPDKPDSRDKLYSANTSLFKTVYNGDVVSLRKFCSPVENQLYHGSCVGNAVVNALELKRIQAGLGHVDLSRFFVYYNARLAHNAIGIDDGTYIRYAMATLNSIGVCQAYLWPYISENVNKRPSWSAYRESYKTKISGYYRIDGNHTEVCSQIEHAIRSSHPVVFGCRVYSDFVKGNLQPGNIARIPTKGENFVGRHAMLIVGFDSVRKLFLVKNSWGDLWANDWGYCWLPYQFLENAEAGDFWVMTTYYKREL